MKNDDIYNMKLHDQVCKKVECGAYDTTSVYILRVAGGWIYTQKSHSVFVPFDNEFLKKESYKKG